MNVETSNGSIDIRGPVPVKLTIRQLIVLIASVAGATGAWFTAINRLNHSIDANFAALIEFKTDTNTRFLNIEHAIKALATEAESSRAKQEARWVDRLDQRDQQYDEHLVAAMAQLKGEQLKMLADRLDAQGRRLDGLDEFIRGELAEKRP